MDTKEMMSTGIPSLDARVKEILQRRPRTVTVTTEFEADFPGRHIETKDNSEIYVVGAGWYFPSAATAIAAGGAKIVAYEMNPEKLGLGQIGMTRADAYFDVNQATTEALLMPEFTSVQLEKLPNVIRLIAGDPSYQELLQKREHIMGIGKKMYDDLPSSQKISKREVMTVKERILDIMRADGVLKIIEQEVTIDMMVSWLEAQKPVFMASGLQVNLDSMGLSHLKGVPGFVEEFLLGSEKTQNLFKAISKLQQVQKDQKRVQELSDTSQNNIPTVAILGNGASALSSALDLLERVEPELQIICITKDRKPNWPPSLIEAQAKMGFRLIRGYVNEIVLSNDERTIESVKVVRYPERETRAFGCSLFIHTHNQRQPLGEWKEESCNVSDLITRLLVEKDIENGLVRDSGIAPHQEFLNIGLRINETFEASLNDDSVMKEKIQDLIKQDPREVTIIVHGDNAMIKRVIWFAAFLGYCGHFIQVALPPEDSQHLELQKALEPMKEKCIWHDVKGQLDEGWINVQNGKFTFKIRDSNGDRLLGVPAADAVVNATRKTKKTLLIRDMIKLGYIREAGEALESNHPTLSGRYSIFGGQDDTIDSPSISYEPIESVTHIEPWGWDTAFDFAAAMLDRRDGNKQKT